MFEYRSVGYTTDCKEGLKVCDVIFEEVQSSMMKHMIKGTGGLFFPKTV